MDKYLKALRDPVQGLAQSRSQNDKQIWGREMGEKEKESGLRFEDTKVKRTV